MCWQDSDMTVEELPLFCMTTPLKYIFLLPGKPASAAPLPSRVGCRCAGTSRPIHRSKAEAGAPSRSTADSALPAPVLLRFHFNTAEGRRERWFSCCRFQRRMWTEKVRGRGPGGGTDNSSPPSRTRPHRSAAFMDNGKNLNSRTLYWREEKISTFSD